MAKKKKGIDAVTSDPKRLRKWLRNPGLRSKLPDQYLSKRQKQNRWLNDPVTPGSSMTNRELRTTSRAAADLRYGGSIRDARDAIGVSQKNEQKVASWYEDYQRQLQQHQNNVQANGQAANAQMNATVQGVRGLDRQDAQGVQQANQQLANVTGAPQLQDQTSDPASVARQGLVAGYGAMLAAQAQNANNYASLLRHVVGPGRKVQAQTTARDKTTAAEKNLAGVRDDARNYRTQYEQSTVQNEAKGILAARIAQGKLDVAAGNNARDNATSRANSRDRASATAGQTNKYGYTNAEWAAMSPAERSAAIRQYTSDTTRPRTGAGKDGKPLPKPDASTLKRVGATVSFANAVKASRDPKKNQWGGTSERMYRYLKSDPTTRSAPPLYLRLAAEVAVDGYIHKKTAAMIRKQLGIRVRDFGYPVK